MLHNVKYYNVQSREKRLVRGCEIFLPGPAYLLCLVLPGCNLAKFANLFSLPCTYTIRKRRMRRRGKTGARAAIKSIGQQKERDDLAEVMERQTRKQTYMEDDEARCARARLILTSLAGYARRRSAGRRGRTVLRFCGDGNYNCTALAVACMATISR